LTFTKRKIIFAKLQISQNSNFIAEN